MMNFIFIFRDLFRYPFFLYSLVEKKESYFRYYFNEKCSNSPKAMFIKTIL